MKHVQLADLTTITTNLPNAVLNEVAKAYKRLKSNPNQLLTIRIAKESVRDKPAELARLIKTAKKRYKELDLHWESSRWYHSGIVDNATFTHFILEVTIL